MSEFNQKRRQQFLNERYYDRKVDFLNAAMEDLEAALFIPEQDEENRVRLMGQIADWHFERFLIRYTGGEPFLTLRDELETVVKAYERYAQYERQLQHSDTYPLFAFQEILYFERLMQLLGLSYLLHRTNLITRIHAFTEGSGYDMEDAVYEEMISHSVPDRAYLENWYHQLPYLHLLNATDAEDPKTKAQELEQYVKVWYPSMEKAPWYGSHTRMTAEGGDYFGYWAFEAGAIAVLYGIDDSAIDHMVYPRHAVEFARNFEQNKEALQRGRCEALKQCPRAGYWYTPARQQSRRKFNSGEIMPDFPGSSWGATIWYWDADQSE